MIVRTDMRFEIITIFPGFFAGIFEHGIVRRAQAEALVGIGVHDLRAFTHDRHRTVDDRPFGGGEGMVLKPEPLAKALGSLGIHAKSSGAKAPLDIQSSSARLKSCPDTNQKACGDTSQEALAGTNQKACGDTGQEAIRRSEPESVR